MYNNPDSKEIDLAKQYAIKAIDKNQVVSSSLENTLINEKLVMQKTWHPFIMKFYRSFKDEKNIYFVVEYIPGSMLFDVIRELDEIDTIEAQFYTSSIILTLECLFKHQIVYRDLKPENIMVD